MKKFFGLLITICMLLSLCGCRGIYSNYREVEQIMVIQTMGIDNKSGGVNLSVASGTVSSGTGPTRLQASAESITAAKQKIRNYSQDTELFYSHVSHVVIGEDTAKDGISDILSYICRSPELRIDVPLYIVKGSTAEETVMKTGNDKLGISEALNAMRADIDSRGDSKLFSAADTMRALDKYGSTLICAVECSPSSEEKQDEPQSSERPERSGQQPGQPQSQQSGGSGQQDEKKSSENLTAVISGYAVIKGDKLCAYIELEQAVGVGFLINNVGISDIVVKDQYSVPVTMEIDQGHSDIKPIWSNEGQLDGLDVSVNVSASVIEISGNEKFGENGYDDYLTAQLESVISDRISAIIKLSKELGADFLGLGSIVERDAPEKYYSLESSFAELLPKLEIKLSVSGRLSNTNDIRDENA